MKRWLPLILVVVTASIFLASLRPPPDKDFAYSEFARLPLVFNGRLKPMDSLARNSLLEIRQKQTLNLEPWKAWNEKPEIIPAIQWLATVMMNPVVADQWPVFRIDNDELIALLKLPGRDPLQHQDGKHYSWAQIAPELEALDREVNRISEREDSKESSSSQRTPVERAVMTMHERLVLYVQLKNTLQPDGEPEWGKEVAAFETLLPAGTAALAARQAGQKYDETTLNTFLAFAEEFKSMARWEPPLVLPPSEPGQSQAKWSRVGDSLLATMNGGTTLNPAIRAYAAMADAFKAHDVGAFNQQAASYRAAIALDYWPELSKSRREVFFNQMQPFTAAMAIYIFAGLLAGLFWFNLSEPLRRSAAWLIVLGFVIHTTGLIFRMALEGRPPVTNLYSSAIFIGWGAVVLGFVLERFYKNGIGTVVAAGMGFITLIIAHHLSFEGDTMEMMRAVLDTNFWLATHVVVVTLGYASTFVAGFLGLIYITRGVFTSTLDAATGKALARMVYGIVCFATLFSFVGTVLGGIWADQSWGRFWGWDPKENGALIIVLWNALILHLRWGGMIRERGLINCSIVGNIVTSWSWFGVNMLGIGLHSYGFTDAAFKWLMLFVGSQLGLVVLGSLPAHMWRSFQNRTTPPSAPLAGGPKGKPAPAGI
jgi:ABC-type transport system involved in cytochrome c biogenesis permease subunit